MISPGETDGETVLETALGLGCIMESERRKIRVATLSVVSNTVLVIMKVMAGFLMGSVSIISEAIHSAMDLVAALIAFFSVKKSGRPADESHPFGHGKIENIAGTTEAVLIFAAAGWIIYEASQKLIDPHPLGTVGWGVGIMLFSSLLNLVVSQKLFKVGRETESVALLADAWHLRTDVYTSAGVMVSLTLIGIGQQISPTLSLYWLDPVAAIGVALFIFKAAYDLTVRSAKDLMDVMLPIDEVEWIDQRIREHQPEIHGYHKLRTRKAGRFRFVEFHIKVDPKMSVEDSHRITDELATSIEGRFPGTSVTVHTEPCDGHCVGKCLEGCFLAEKGDTPSHASPQ